MVTVSALCFGETLLTGRHESMKTGRERSLIPLHFHVFIFSCFSVEK
jgi:hypothetical protein